MKFLLIYLSFGGLTVLLTLIQNRLQHPEKSFFDREIMTRAQENWWYILVSGPLLFLVGIMYLIQNRKLYQTKKTYVLRKFES